MILGIDPGTKCGWALEDGPTILHSGMWDLSGGRHSGGGMRFVHLSKQLNELHHVYGNVQQVFYEEVRRHLGVDAAHVYGGMIATLSAWCEQRNIPYQGIPVGTVKKFATGKGNAGKDEMMAAARKQWPTQVVCDDNQADALWILATGTVQILGGNIHV